MTTKTLEQRAAEAIERLEKLFEGDDSLTKTIDRVKAIQSRFEELKGLDPAKIATEIDKIKATQETFTKMIRTSKKGLYVPGLEDHEFSLLKACVAVKTKSWKGAEKEEEILKATREKAAQVIGNDAVGGYFVPDQVIPEVIGAIYTKSVFVNLQGDGDKTRVSVLEGLQGGNVKIPKFDGGLVAYWIGEEDDYAESQTSVGDVTLNPKKMGVLIRMTDSMRRFAGFGFEKLLRTDLVRAAAKKLDWTIAFGRGTNDMPLGITRQPGIKIYRAENGLTYDQNTAAGRTALAAITDWDGAELNYDGLMNMLLALEEDDVDLDETAAIISSPRFFHKLKQLKADMYSGQTTNQMYLTGLPFMSDQRLRELIGDFAKSTQIPSDDLPGATIDGPTDSTNEKHTTVFGGNLGNVILGRWGGIEIEDDGGKGAGFVSDHTYVKLRLYADVGVREPRSLIVCPDAKVRA